MSATQEFLKRRAVEVQTFGRYSLASRHDAKGVRRQFACRTTRISPFQMLVTAPIAGPIGERVISYFGEFGNLDGFITDIISGGFLLDLKVSRDDRQRLASKLEWMEARAKDPTVADARQQQRVIPRDPRTTLLFADGTASTCFAIDISSSGVAVSADVDVEIGMRLAVGRSVGHVVRRFEEGFAVQFDRLVDPSRLEEAIRPTSELIVAAAVPQKDDAVVYLD